MKPAVGAIKIRKVIVHTIPKISKTDADSRPLILRNAECNLEAEAEAQLESRLRGVLKESGRQIVEDISAPAKTPAILRGFLQNAHADFVSMSQELAQVLRDSQSGANSAGILLVAECDTDGSGAVLIVKIEQEGGLRAEETDDVAESQDVRYFSDLFLTSRSKVYKVALFSAEDVEGELLYGWAADKQMTGGNLAVFFLRKYLGCRHLDEPQEVTRLFHQHSQDWINIRVADPGTRARYAMALASELLSERSTISPQAFAYNHIRTQDREGYLSHLEANGLPRSTFDKNIALVESRLSRFSVAFGSGVVLTAPRSALDNEVVKFESLEGQVDRVIITDTVEEIKGRGASGRSSSKSPEPQ